MTIDRVSTDSRGATSLGALGLSKDTWGQTIHNVSKYNSWKNRQNLQRA